MRTVSSSIMAALVVCALFWGNCLTCPQMLHQQAHRCCPHPKQAKAGCTNQALQQFVKADTGTDAQPPAAIPAILEESPLAAAVQPMDIAAEPSSTSHAPPGSFSLRI